MKGRLLKLLLLSAGCSLLVSQLRQETSLPPYVDGAGNISLPQGYRDNWTHLGTYFVTGETPGSNSMHSVYTERRYLEAYNDTGDWPDGAVIVKEVMHTAQARLTTGAANWASGPDVWFVIVKDRHKRFPDNPLWGDGWGWALFNAEAPDTQVARDYKSDCLGCHLPARETGYVYLQGYPAIRKRPKSPAIVPSRTAPARTGESGLAGGSAERGAGIFSETCSFCHALDGAKSKLGPSLAVIAGAGKLPSGKPATPENILNQIDNGGGGMPSFSSSLETSEKADLIAYLRRTN